MIMLFLIGTFGLNFPIFISTMAVSVFHTDARGFGLLSSTMAVGTISGALLAAGRAQPRFVSLLLGAAAFGAGCTLAALAPSYWLFAGSLVLIGVAALTVTNTSNAMMQLSTEPRMRGRVMALRLGVALGGTPIGAPIVGWVADNLGPRWALGVGAAAGFAAALVAARAMSARTAEVHERMKQLLGDRGAGQFVQLRLERGAVRQRTQRRTHAQPAGIAGLRGENGLQRRQEGRRLHHDIDRGLHAGFDILAVDHRLDQLRRDVGHAADGAGAAAGDRTRDVGFVADGDGEFGRSSAERLELLEVAAGVLQARNHLAVTLAQIRRDVVGIATPETCGI